MASSRTACGARTGIVLSTCDASTGYGLANFKMSHSAELNKIVEATMRVNPYDDGWVCMRSPNGKDDLDIVQAS